MGMFLAVLRYKVPIEVVEKHVQAHRDYLGKWYERNKLIVSGPMVPRVGGVILFNADSREEVEAIIKEDPFYIEGVADYEMTEFLPVKSDPRFRELFVREEI
jgi:uncharacterized protein YciI